MGFIDDRTITAVLWKRFGDSKTPLKALKMSNNV